MLNSHTPIEQFIYTACGKNARGDFSIWSASNKDLKQTSYNKKILDILKVVYDGNIVLEKDSFGKPIKRTFDKQIFSSKELKPNAKPSGLFRKTYKDSDFQIVERVDRDEIHVVQESGSDGLKKQIGYSDFRGKEENSPYRIAWTKLDDGRLLLCRTSAIGSVYSQLDQRMGNLFYHAYIFPAGTEITDIDLSKIEFKKGLDEKYWSKNPEPAPEYLPAPTINDLYTKTNQTATQQKSNAKENPNLMNQEELIELFKKSILSKDQKEKSCAMREFAKQKNLGINVSSLLNTLYEKNIKKLENHQKVTDEDELILTSLELLDTPFSTLFYEAEKYYNLKIKYNMAEYDDVNRINQELSSTKQHIKDIMSKVDLDKLVKEADARKNCIVNSVKFDLLLKGKTINNKGMCLPENEERRYSSADMIYRTAQAMKKSNLTFDEQKII